MNKELKTIRNVLFPMRTFNWLMGCGEIIEYPLGNPHETISFLYSLAWALNYYIMTYLVRYYKSNMNIPDRTDQIFQVALFYFYLIFLVPAEAIFMVWKRGKEVKIIFKNISKVDNLLRRLKISDEYAKMYKTQILLTAFTATMIIISLTVTWRVDKSVCASCIFGKKLVFVMKTVYPRILMFLNDFTFISYVTCLKQKFTQLNDMLQAMSGTSYLYPQYMKVFNFAMNINEEESSKLGKKTNDDIQIMKIAKKAHLDLVKISKQINRSFGLHLLISIVQSPLILIYLIYLSYIAYKFNDALSLNFSIHVLNLYLPYVIRICAVNYICEKTSNEAKRTGRIICELHEPSSNQQFRSEIQDFTLQLNQNPLEFTALGFVTLNHALILDIVGSITTYLVILIQLREMDEG